MSSVIPFSFAHCAHPHPVLEKGGKILHSHRGHTGPRDLEFRRIEVLHLLGRQVRPQIHHFDFGDIIQGSIGPRVAAYNEFGKADLAVKRCEPALGKLGIMAGLAVTVRHDRLR